MARYIDADKTIELLKSLGSRDYRREKGTICDAIKMLQYPEYTPTADVVSRAEIAEIFEEIEHETKNHGICYTQRKISELKKKYTEGNK